MQIECAEPERKRFPIESRAAEIKNDRIRKRRERGTKRCPIAYNFISGAG
jgi:hypothetical protein